MSSCQTSEDRLTFRPDGLFKEKLRFFKILKFFRAQCRIKTRCGRFLCVCQEIQFISKVVKIFGFLKFFRFVDFNFVCIDFGFFVRKIRFCFFYLCQLWFDVVFRFIGNVDRVF